MLTRFIKSLASGNLKVGLLELFVLVLGLFMGFQLDRWNEERLRQQNAEIYVQQLSNDLQADLTGSQWRIDMLLQVKQHGLNALKLWDDAPIDKPSDLVVSLYQASQIYPFVASMAPYEVLKSTANVDLVGDASTRSGLFLYYNSHEVNRAAIGGAPQYRLTVRGIIPFQVQELIRGRCAYLVPGLTTTDQLTDTCDIEISKEQTRRILASAREHPSLLNELHQKLSQDRILRDLYASQVVGARTLTEMLTSP
ncbi:MAG: hypothetical protein P8I38_02340 [Arenicella sp.]|nr:hypothetical protein [Arenicella sp.]